MLSPDTTALLGLACVNAIGIARVLWNLTRPPAELKPLHGTDQSAHGTYSYIAYWLKQEVTPAGMEVEVFRVKDPTVRRRTIRVVIHDRDGSIT